MLHFKNRHNKLQKTHGFTIIELLVIAPVVLLTIGIFVTAIVGMTGDVLASRSASSLVYNIQDSLNRIEQDVKLSSSFLATNSFTPTTPQGFDDGTAGYKNSSVANGAMLILNTATTTSNPVMPNSSLVYAINSPNSCTSTQITNNTPQMINIIYFVKGGTLWRRVVVPSNYLDTASSWCATPWQQPSCTPGYINAFCKSNDIQLVTGLGTSGFTVDYFNGANTTGANTVAADASASDTSRAAALLTATTASIGLTATQTAAGRDITQSGTIRATRLDTNASAVAIPVAPTVPLAPIVTASTASPNTAIFNWQNVPGAATYTVNYSIDGGAYVNGATGTTSTTFSIPGRHNKSVCATVYAVNTAGTSAFGSGCVTIPLWVPFKLQNSWLDYGSPFASASFTKTSDGMIVLKGLVKAGIATSGVVIGQLPVGYRPSETLLFQNSTNSTAGRIDIDTSGNVIFQVGSNAWYSLDGINFMPSSATFTATGPFSNSWVNYGSGFAPASYFSDTSGRVHLKGLVANGVTTDGTVITTIPTALQPSLFEHISNDVANGVGSIGISNSGGGIIAKGGSNAYVGLQALFYPSTYAGWTALPLLNGWVYYGAPYSTPRYTKSTDGMVVIKGLIRAGDTTPGLATANLPAGYCPKQQMLLTTISNNVWARFDVTAGTGSGCSIILLSASALWASLDDITFFAEW